MVYLVVVFITTPFPVMVALTSVVPRSYISCSSGSISNISTTFETRYGKVTI